MTTIFDVKVDKLFAYIFFILAFVIPGFGILYITDQNIFANTDVYKLTLLSILFSIPIFFIGIITANSIEKYFPNKPTKSKEDEALNYFSMASLISILIFYAAILEYLYSKFHSLFLTDIFSSITAIYLYSIIAAFSLFILLWLKSKCKKQ